MSGDALRFRDQAVYPMATHEDRRKGEVCMNKQSLQDNIPIGAIAFFDKLQCPQGWSSYTAVGTRSIKGATSNIEATTTGLHSHTVFCDIWKTNIYGSGNIAVITDANRSSNQPTITPAYIKYICCEKVVR